MLEDRIREMLDGLDDVTTDTKELEKRLMEIMDVTESSGEPISKEIIKTIETGISSVISSRAGLSEYVLRQLEAIAPFFKRYRSSAIDLLPIFDAPPKVALNSGTEKGSDIRSVFDQIGAELFDWIPVEWLAKQRDPGLRDRDSLGLPAPREAARILTALHAKSRTEGLLSLEDDIESLPTVLAKLIQPIVDGYAPEVVDIVIHRHFSHHRRILEEYEEVLRNTVRLIVDHANPHVIETVTREPYTDPFPEYDSTSRYDTSCGPGLIAFSEGLEQLADALRRSGPLAVREFPSDHFPKFLQNVPELIGETIGKPDLAEYLSNRLFVSVNDAVFYSEQVCRQLIRCIYRGDGPLHVEQLSELVCAGSGGISAVELDAAELRSRVPRCRQPVQALVKLERYALALNDYVSVLQELHSQTEDSGIAHWAADEIESLTSEHVGWNPVLGELAILEKRYAEHDQFIHREEEIHRRIQNRINRMKAEQVDSGERELSLNNVHHLADSEQRERFTRFLLETYAKSKHEEAQADAERRSMYAARIENAARDIFGQPLGEVVFDKRGRLELELSVVEKLYPYGPTALTEIIRDLFADKEDRKLFGSLTWTLDDIAGVDDRTVQKIVLATDLSVLSLALSGVDERVVGKIMNAFTPLRQAHFRQALDANRAAPAVAIHGARDEILLKIRELEQRGEIVLVDHFLDWDDFGL